MELGGQGVVVIGLARSGIAAARFLARQGAHVVAMDLRQREELGDEVVALEGLGVRLALGAHDASTLLSATLVVVSPGVAWDLPALVQARAAGVPVMAELELAARFAPGPLIAVTGTKGKSTTTAAVGAMLRASQLDARVGGNIGHAALTLVEDATPETVLVLEVSSFQLEGCDTLHPRVAAFLNLSDDHLDRHGSIEAYASAKGRIFRNQGPEDWAVIPADDERVRGLAAASGARLVRWAMTRPADADPAAFFEDGRACLLVDGRLEALFERAAVRLPGEHLAADLLVAGAVARLAGAEPAAMARAVACFKGAEHVLELAAEVDGVSYFNDSKATNVAAASEAVKAFDRPVILIAGGRFKGGDLGRLAEAIRGRTKRIVLMGESADLLAEALCEVAPVERSASMADAVARARAAATAGDVVVLAPACASFDMFADYAERGRAFKRIVRAMVPGGSTEGVA